ncbi:MAG: hypothetical protein FJX29_10195 [Alphaproteobacteria bacterium]|nr:hypothetical protein [Alphaproteobacteria bacterium]
MMKITAQDLLKFGIIDTIIAEPAGGAHRDPDQAVQLTGDAIAKALDEMAAMSAEALRDARAAKFLAMGRKV